MLTGVYLATKKDKTVYYRSNITHKGRHISLGSFPTEVQAHQAYTAACELLSGTETIDEAFYRSFSCADASFLSFSRSDARKKISSVAKLSLVTQSRFVK